MSLTSFLQENPGARDYLGGAFPKPSIGDRRPLLVPSTSANPGETGTAFDYVFRFHLQRLNPHTVVPHPWVAFKGAKVVERFDSTLGRKAQNDIAQAESRLVAFLKTDDQISDSLLTSAVLLARLDIIYRSGRGLERLAAPVPAAQLQELRALARQLSPQAWRTEGDCVLNPVFGAASVAIGGADADAIVGTLLVDVKSTKNLELIRDDWLQIVGYRLLMLLDEGLGGGHHQPVDSLGVYFARYGYLAAWNVQRIATDTVWRESVDWLAAALQLRKTRVGRELGQNGLRLGANQRIKTPKVRRGLPMGSGPRYELVSVDAIELDTSNPRIAHALSSYKPPYKAEQIYLALNAGAKEEEGGSATTFNKLRQSILTNGGISQPVHLHEKAKGRYVSIEGNTRVAIYQEFRQQKLRGQWDKIPAFIYTDLHDEQLHAIRLQAHLVGPRPWDPYSKAKYLRYLRNELMYPFERLVDLCGGNKRSIQESLDAYEDMEAYYRPLLRPGQPFDTDRFSGFVELQKPGVKQALQQTGFTVKDFAEWIRSRKIERLADVRVLPRVLKDPKARQVFLDSDIDAAKKVLDLPEVSETLQKAGLLALCRALTQTIQKVEFSELRKLKQDLSSPMVQDISETFDSLKGLLEEIGLEGNDS